MLFSQTTVMVLSAATIVGMAIGGLWYSNLLFQPAWRRLSGQSQEAVDAAGKRPQTYVIAFIALFLKSIVLYSIISLKTPSIVAGFCSGLLLATAIAASAINCVLWESRSWQYYGLNMAYVAVNSTAMGALIGYLLG